MRAWKNPKAPATLKTWRVEREGTQKGRATETAKASIERLSPRKTGNSVFTGIPPEKKETFGKG
jgi:hypothetical protein